MPAYFDSGILVGESAWHGLGHVIGRDDERKYDLDYCLGASGLDREIRLGECYYYMDTEGGDQVCDVVPDKRVTLIADDDAPGGFRPLGVVGTQYEVLQNRQAFEWFQPWLDSREVAIETAGSLKDGRVAWVLARIERGDIEISSGDWIRKYLLFSTSHDGTEANRVGFNDTRVVCANTLAAAHNSRLAKMMRVRHTARQTESLDAIRDTINLIDGEFEATAKHYRKMLDCKLSTSELRRYVKLVCDIEPDMDEDALSGRLRNRIDRIADLAITGAGQDGTRTVWAAFNGVTQYLTHELASDAERRILSNQGGVGADMNRRAFDLAVQLSS